MCNLQLQYESRTRENTVYLLVERMVVGNRKNLVDFIAVMNLKLSIFNVAILILSLQDSHTFQVRLASESRAGSTVSCSLAKGSIPSFYLG